MTYVERGETAVIFHQSEALKPRLSFNAAYEARIPTSSRLGLDIGWESAKEGHQMVGLVFPEFLSTFSALGQHTEVFWGQPIS